MVELAQKVGDNLVHLRDMKYSTAKIDSSCRNRPGTTIPHFGHSSSSTFITEMRAMLQEPAACGVHEESVL